jgi:hypothetical protein
MPKGMKKDGSDIVQVDHTKSKTTKEAFQKKIAEKS